MKRIIFSIFIILSLLVFSVSAQTGAQAAFEKGMNSAQSGKYETALAEFQTSLAFAESDHTKNEFLAKIHFNIGVCLYQLKQNKQAVPEFEQAVKLNGGDYEKAFYALGMTQAELKNWQAAEQAFRGAIGLNRRSGEAWFDLAFVYLAQNDFDSARNAFQKSVQYKSVASPVSHNNLGVISAINGDLTSAVKEFEKALKESNGKFTVAERNLQFCKSLGQNLSGDLVAKLEFKK
ncbi:MAG: tetratricopeptide repeat protein [Actinomycetota bacterium]